METIYNWLLQNTGNAGNHYTILNIQHETDADESNYIDVMARDKNHSIVNLLIHHIPAGESAEIGSDRLHDRKQIDTCIFQNDQQLIDYLSQGKAFESADEAGDRIEMVVLEPTETAGTITFPPIN